MKRYFFALAISCGIISCETLSNLPSSVPVTITEADAAQGIREALDQGVGRGISTLNKPDGFFGNQAYKVLLPPDAQKIENTLRSLGMDGVVDKAILQINRAAEDAVGFARPIFLEAIREMTIADAINIIRGQKNAATEYFRQKTTEKLTAAFSPVVRSSLERFNATKYYTDVISTYNNFPTTINKINPDLPSYVVDRTVTALFDQVAQEEARIRENPVARTSEILKKVFGWAARN
jgi:ABC-type transporter MlaC component